MTARKRERQRTLVELLDARSLRSQHEVCEALRERGIAAHQGTVSRDLRELGAVRGGLEDGYHLPPDARERATRQAAAAFDSMLRTRGTRAEALEGTNHVLLYTCQAPRELRTVGV